MIISVTGHRPGTIGLGSNYNSDSWKKLIEIIKDLLIEYKCTELITGLGLGVETASALATIALKRTISNIKLHCAIPCKSFASNWPEGSRKLYEDILSKADIFTIVSGNTTYTPSVVQMKNQYLIDHSDMMIIVWNGIESGSTYDCIQSVKKVGKKIILVDPRNNSIKKINFEEKGRAIA